MNISQINEIRATAGLPALSPNAEKTAAAKKRQAANHAARAEANRALKDARSRNKK